MFIQDKYLVKLLKVVCCIWELPSFPCNVDNYSSNDVVIQYLKRRLNNWRRSVLKGEHLHIKCAVHILSLIIKEGLSELNYFIIRICNVVKYIRASPARLQNFKSSVKRKKKKSKSCLPRCLNYVKLYLFDVGIFIKISKSI